MTLPAAVTASCEVFHGIDCRSWGGAFRRQARIILQTPGKLPSWISVAGTRKDTPLDII